MMLGSLPAAERERRVNIMLGKTPSAMEAHTVQHHTMWWRRQGGLARETGAPGRPRGPVSTAEGAKRGQLGGDPASLGSERAGKQERGTVSASSRQRLIHSVCEVIVWSPLRRAAGCCALLLALILCVTRKVSREAQAALRRLAGEEWARQEEMARVAQANGAEQEELQSRLEACAADLDAWLEKVEGVKEQVGKAKEEEAERMRDRRALVAAADREEAECRALDSEAAAHIERGRVARTVRENSGVGNGIAQRQLESALRQAEITEAEEALAVLNGELLERQASLQGIREVRQNEERRARELDEEASKEMGEVRDALRTQAFHGRHAQAELYREKILREQEREALCRSVQREVMLQGQQRAMRVESVLEREMEWERARAHQVVQAAREADEEEEEIRSVAQRLVDEAQREEAVVARRRIEALHAARMAELQCRLVRARRDVSRAHSGVEDVCEMLEAATELSWQLTSTLEREQGDGVWCGVNPRPSRGGEDARQRRTPRRGNREGDGGDRGGTVEKPGGRAGWRGGGIGGADARTGGGSEVGHAVSGVNPRYRQQLLRLQLHALKRSREAD